MILSVQLKLACATWLVYRGNTSVYNNKMIELLTNVAFEKVLRFWSFVQYL